MAPARSSPHARPTYSPYSYADDDPLLEVTASDRVGPPPRNLRRRNVVLGALVAGLGAAAVWTWAQDRDGWNAWATLQVAALAPSLERSLAAAGKRETGAAPTAQPAPLAPLEAAPPSPSNRLAEQTPMGPAAAVIANAVPRGAVPDAEPEEAPQALPPPPTPTDPLQARALAAGLHPTISRVVLAKLTATDFDNAAAAIRKAIAEVADDGSLVWPAQRRPEQALFKVHFVAGAATPDCRRYVVAISKDGWLTTALPMERCGVRLSKAQRG